MHMIKIRYNLALSTIISFYHVLDAHCLLLRNEISNLLYYLFRKHWQYYCMSFRPIKSIIAQVEATTIDPDNLIKAMGAVEGLEKLEAGKDISGKLESRCKSVATVYLTTANVLSKFVQDNCDNINLVTRLLKKCEGGLKPPPAVRCKHINVQYQARNYICACLNNQFQ